ncbi:hypothetical protein [Mycobacterium ahvazicum]|uniref:hypothetical protein n=1 Tax=Mycobacterium ahvazicum TaxID=1964395 RepID=UPI0010575154|nr:hypothetical protein [Mycobacterium ahvazicum]
MTTSTKGSVDDPALQDSVFTSFDPRDGSALANYPIHSRADVDRIVARARTASDWWSGLSYAGRRAGWTRGAASSPLASTTSPR